MMEEFDNIGHYHEYRRALALLKGDTADKAKCRKVIKAYRRLRKTVRA